MPLCKCFALNNNSHYQSKEWRTDGKEAVLRKRTPTEIRIFSPTFPGLVSALNKPLHISIQAIPTGVFQYSPETLAALPPQHKILTHLQNAAMPDCEVWILPTSSMDQPLYPALWSLHLLSPSGRFNNRSDSGKKTVPIHDASQTSALLEEQCRAS